MKHPNILLVQQEPAVARAIALALGRKDCRFAFAADIPSAMTALAEKGSRFDLVIANAEPSDGGQDFLMRAKRFHHDVNVLMLINGGVLSTESKPRSAGSARTMNTPIDFNELQTVVSGCCADDDHDDYPPPTAMPLLHPFEITEAIAA